MNPARKFLELTPERRARAFEQAATQRAVDAVIIEKDFWARDAMSAEGRMHVDGNCLPYAG